MCLGRVDNVIPIIEPTRDQCFDHAWGVLAVSIHEEDGTRTGMIQAGEQGGFLAEIARKRDDLNVERHRGQGFCDVAGTVVTTVVYINYLDAQSAFGLEIS